MKPSPSAGSLDQAGPGGPEGGVATAVDQAPEAAQDRVESSSDVIEQLAAEAAKHIAENTPTEQERADDRAEAVADATIAAANARAAIHGEAAPTTTAGEAAESKTSNSDSNANIGAVLRQLGDQRTILAVQGMYEQAVKAKDPGAMESYRELVKTLDQSAVRSDSDPLPSPDIAALSNALKAKSMAEKALAAGYDTDVKAFDDARIELPRADALINDISKRLFRPGETDAAPAVADGNTAAADGLGDASEVTTPADEPSNEPSKRRFRDRFGRRGKPDAPAPNDGPDPEAAPPVPEQTPADTIVPPASEPVEQTQPETPPTPSGSAAEQPAVARAAAPSPDAPAAPADAKRRGFFGRRRASTPPAAPSPDRVNPDLVAPPETPDNVSDADRVAAEAIIAAARRTSEAHAPGPDRGPLAPAVDAIKERQRFMDGQHAEALQYDRNAREQSAERDLYEQVRDRMGGEGSVRVREQLRVDGEKAAADKAREQVKREQTLATEAVNIQKLSLKGEAGRATIQGGEPHSADMAKLQRKLLNVDNKPFMEIKKGGLFHLRSSRRGPKTVESYFRDPSNPNLIVATISNRKTGEMLRQDAISTVGTYRKRLGRNGVLPPKEVMTQMKEIRADVKANRKPGTTGIGDYFSGPGISSTFDQQAYGGTIQHQGPLARRGGIRFWILGGSR